MYFNSTETLQKIFLTVLVLKKKLPNLIQVGCLFLLLQLISINPLKAQTTYETIPTGSYIINMGVQPQTTDNALKPYGLLFELLSENYIPIKWVIRPDKGKDEYDFVYQGTQYKGGPFIILAKYRSAAINGIIADWEALGVVGLTTTSQVTVPVYQTIDYFMNWTLDQANGSKVVPYFANAGIDPTSYNWVLPNELTCCNDIFVMPHADPVWDTHSRLFSWTSDIQTDPNGCDGSIWAACHAVSALENAFNPANPSQQMNFLSQKTATATGTNDWADNSLQLWRDHNSGTLPPAYIYGEHGHPVMQFLGNLDNATENGSEQIYIPQSAGWRPESKIGVWDHDHPDVVTGGNEHRAVKAVFGDAFGDPTKGKVMYEGGHTHAKGTDADIPAQRAFFNFSFWSVQGKAIRVTMNGIPNPSTINGSTPITLTANASGGTNVYNYQWVASCGGTFSNANAATTTFTPDAVANLTNCTITCIVTDDCNTRTGFVSESITVIPAPAPPVAVNDTIYTLPNNSVTLSPLDNDSDPNLNLDPTTLTLTGPTTTSNGVFTDNGNGTVSYTPNLNFEGMDSVTYQICDDTPIGDGGPFCDVATILITVSDLDANGCNSTEYYTGSVCENAYPVAVDDTIELCEDNAKIINVLTNDSDPQASSLSVNIFASPGNGLATVNTDGTITYQPSVDFSGTDQLSYRICNTFKGGLCDSAVLMITIVDDGCAAGQYIMESPAGITDSVRSELDPYMDNHGTQDWASVWTEEGDDGAHGGGNIKYDKDGLKIKAAVVSEAVYREADLTGAITATLTYDVTKATLETTDEIVSEVSNDGGTSYTILKTYNSSTVLGSESFNLITVLGVVSPQTRIRFRVLTVGNAKDLVVNNIQISYNTETVRSELDPYMDNHGTQDWTTFWTEEGEDGAHGLGNIKNDKVGLKIKAAVVSQAVYREADLSGATIAIVSYDITKATLETTDEIVSEVSNNGGTSYTILKTYNSSTVLGSESFNLITVLGSVSSQTRIRFRVLAKGNSKDLVVNNIQFAYGAGGGCSGSCEALPNQPPLASSDSGTTPSDTPINLVVVSNDADPENGILTVTELVTLPSNGTATLELNGSITYDPQNFTGEVSFTYSVCDDGSPIACDTATVNITSTNLPPVAQDDVVTATSGTTSNINVLADNGNGIDSDPEGANVMISEITSPPTNGTANVNDNATPGDPTDDFLEYTPNAGFTGVDTLYYSICDPELLCDTAMVAITVDNQAPTADTEVVSTDECQAILVEVLPGDTDPENGILTVTAATVTLGSGSTVVNFGQTVTFTPDGGFTGAATVEYTVCDNGTPQQCTTGTINITVNSGISAGNAPIAVDDAADPANIGQTVYIPVKDNDSDPEGTQLKVNLTKAGLTPPSSGTISLLNNGLISYTPTGGSGVDHFQYWICETYPTPAPGCPSPPSLCDSATVIILIENQNPIAIMDEASTGMDQAISIDVLTNDVEPDNQELTITGVGTDVTPSNGTTVNGGTVTINTNNNIDPSDDFIDYVPFAGFTGEDTFSYQICDDNTPQACDITTVTVNVTAPMDLEISLTASQPTAPLGTSITFTLTVTNTGGNDATGVLAKDQLPDGYTYVSDDSGGAYDPISGIWNVGTVTSGGGSSTILITATLDSPTNTYNTAQVYRANEFDTDSTPNNDDGDQSEDDEAFAVVIPDSDGDGIADNVDVDDDNDGVLDIDEDNGTGFDPSGDTDADGIPNYLDQSDVTVNFPTFVDLDHNGINDNFDHDKDGIPDHLDLDTDNDGIPDFVEAGGTDANNDGQADYVTPNDPATMTDLDNDGLADAYDPDYNTAIANSDSDSDGLTDAYDLDSDNDGIADLVEVGGVDTNGNGLVDEMSNPSTGDTNNNGWADVIETTVLVDQSLTDNGIDFDGDTTPNHLDLDADNDGILDVVESGGLDGNNNGIADDGSLAGTITDANGDGWEDNYDGGTLTTSADGTDGNSSPDFVTGNGNPDFDADGQPNWLDIDADNDGIVDNTEGQSTGAYIAPAGAGDTDGDGINDAYDSIVGFGGAGISPENTDQSDNPDYLDLDTDNDGEGDLIEGHDSDANGTADSGSPANAGIATGTDSDFDGLDDGFDNNIGLVEATDGGLTPSSFVDADGGTIERDWREVIDLDIDDDGIVNADEDGGTGFDPTADADNDGILNYLDDNDVTASFPTFLDSNGDGVNDAYDSDLDGIPDYKDLDSDNDGIPDIVEAGGTDADNNGIADNLTDSDGDGLVDTYDAGTTSNIPNPDTDGDTISDAYDLDSDNDGIADLVEVGGLDTDGNGKVDTMTDPATGDTDDNGWADVIETTVLVNQSLTNDTSIDFDGDTYPNHLDIDADNDGIVDVIEAGGVDANGDGLADDGTGSFVDVNGDGWDDGHDDGEITTATDGADVNNNPDYLTGTGNPDFDADGQPNWLDIDADNDGIVDNTEGQSTAGYTAPLVVDPDIDNDGLNDAYELVGTIGVFGGIGIIPVNTELVDNPDYLDLDTDNDGEADAIEGHDTDGNGIADAGSPSNTGLPGGYADADGDGLLDGYDNNISSTDPTNGSLNPSSHPDFDGNSSERDWRENAIPDIDKDNDGIVDAAEDGGTGFVPDGDEDNDGTPNYQDTNDPAFTNTDSNNDGVVDAFDSDGDGIADFLDLDADNDGIPDIIEAGGTDTNGDGIADPLADSDGDGIPNTVDSSDPSCSGGDTNTDGICDDAQGGTDTDGDGIQDANDPDVDGDGLADLYDTDYNTAIPNTDTDGDGLPDAVDLDADNDGLPDLIEVGGIDTNGDGRIDTAADADTDGWADISETYLLVDNDLMDTNIDSDNDGFPDHLDLDADNDGIPDVIEAGGSDDDGDGMVDTGLAPWDADKDGLADVYDQNASDGPGNAGFNGTALIITTAETGTPDGRVNSTESMIAGGANVINADTDFIPNHLDLDADNDGIVDILEAGGVDNNGDGLVDDFIAANPGAFDTADNDGWSPTYDGDAANDGPVTTIGDGTPIILTTDNDFNGIPESYTLGDTDQDNHPNFLDIDADNDGIVDNVEAQDTPGYTLPDNMDADNDGLDDAYDNFIGFGGTGIDTDNGDAEGTENDHDGDNIPDYLDADSDNDNVPDMQEAWDNLFDGDSRVDATIGNCDGTDIDNDGLLDCFDSDTNSPVVTSYQNPVDDNGDEGASTTAMAPTSGADPSEIYPNNSAGDGQPDWRDIIIDCGTPQVYYASTEASAGTTTDYEYNGTNHVDQVDTKVVRATTYCSPGDGWFYFYNPLEPENYLFALKNAAGSPNTVPINELIDFVEIKVEADPTNRHVVDATQANFVMERDWNIELKDTPTPGSTFDVKFYFPPAEMDSLAAAADEIEAAATGTVTRDFYWFGKNGGVTNSDITSSGVTGSTDISTNDPNNVTDDSADLIDGTSSTSGNAKNYVSFTGLSDLSGGTAGILMSYAALPVTLVDFTATVKGCLVTLDWSSASEENFSHYDLERSNDGRIFESIAQQKRMGGNVLTRYQFADNHPSSTNYYRLKMVDYDGYTEYSKVVVASMDCEKANTKLVVYPNPIRSDELLTVTVETAKGEAVLVISDLAGRIMKAISIETNTGSNQVRMDLAGLPSGIYFITNQNEEHLEPVKFVKMRK